MQCKSLWIKASAKCINVNVNVLVHDVTTKESSFKKEQYQNSLVIFERDANGLIRFNDLC